MITGVLLDKFNINNLYLISGSIISLLSILLVYSKKNRKWIRRFQFTPKISDEKRNSAKGIF